MALRNTLNKSLRQRLDRALDRIADLERTETTLLREQAAEKRSVGQLSEELRTLKRILAAHILTAEHTGYDALAHVLRRALGNAGLDLSTELHPANSPFDLDALPPRRVLTAEEARLSADLHRSEKARGALDEQCRDLQHINEVQARELRAIAETRLRAAAKEVTP